MSVIFKSCVVIDYLKLTAYLTISTDLFSWLDGCKLADDLFVLLYLLDLDCISSNTHTYEALGNNGRGHRYLKTTSPFSEHVNLI